MSIVRMHDLDASHSVQPVVPRMKGMESVDRSHAAARIGGEIATARSQTMPFAGYYTANEDPAAIAAANEERLASEAEETAD